MLNFIRSKTNESSKRLIAFLFALTLIILALWLRTPQIIGLLFYSIWLLLGLAAAETISGLFSKK